MSTAFGVRGAEFLKRKKSAVDAQGGLRKGLIDGVQFRPTRSVPHEAGHLTEIIRGDWFVAGASLAPIVQTYMTTTLPGRVRGWGFHKVITDRLFVASGLMRIVVFDGREGSRTCGQVDEFTLSEKNSGLLIIPPGLHHAWKNIGDNEAIVISMPDILYDYDVPDSFTLPWDSEEARSIIPYRW